MAYIAVDLDVLEKCEHVARATGADCDHIFASLFRLWKWCFTEKVDHVRSCQVDGFGLSGAALHDALTAFGFLDPDSNGFRVRGAGRYLRVMKAQKEAAARTNAMKRSSDGRPSGIPHGTPTPKDGIPDGRPNGGADGRPNGGADGRPNGGADGPKSPSPPTPPSSPEHRTSNPEGDHPPAPPSGSQAGPRTPEFKLTGQEAKRAQAKHIGPETELKGLDTVDQCRRAYALRWAKVHGGNGAVFPDMPGADRKVIAEVLDYHRRNHLTTPWKTWVLAVFDAYLAINNDRLVADNVHALRFLPGCLPRVVTAVAKEMQEQQEVAKS